MARKKRPRFANDSNRFALASRGAKASPRPGPKPAEVKPSDMTVGELRAMLAEKFPDARPDELSHQLLGRRSRLPASCLHPRAEVCLSVEVPSATVDWFNEIALRLWPSRLPQT